LSGLVIAAACLAASLALAACSDSDSSENADTTASDSQPMTDFLAAATPICDRASAALARVQAPSSFPAVLEDFGEGAKATLAAIEAEYTELAALDPPASNEAEFAIFAQSLSDVIVRAEQLQQLVSEGNDDTDALWLPQVQIDTLHGKAMDAAAAMGLDSCTTLNYSEGE